MTDFDDLLARYEILKDRATESASREALRDLVRAERKIVAAFRLERKKMLDVSKEDAMPPG